MTTDLQGNVIVVGITDSVDFPTTPGAYKPALPGPLQVRQSGAQTFQSIGFSQVEKVNAITFSADGFAGYADAMSVSHDDSIYRTSDGGRTWQHTATHLPYGASSLVIDPSAPSTVYALNVFNLYRSTDAGDTWTKVIYPSQNNYSPSFLAIDPTNSNRLFLILGSMPSRVLRSLDGGITWQQLSTGLPYDANVIAIDPNHPEVVYSAGSFENVFRSRDGGDTWSQLLPGVSPSFIRAKLTVDSSSTLYAATGAGIYKSVDNGDTYKLIPTPNGALLDKFEIDPRDGSHFLLSTNSYQRYSLFESHDSGATWSGLSLNITSLSAIAIRGNSLFAVTPPTGQVFVTKWNSWTGMMSSATYLGPSQFTAPKVVTDRNGYIYVSGEALGSGFPVTPGAFLERPGPNVSGVGFVSKLSPDLSQLVWSTLVGGGFTGSQFQPPTYISDLQVDGTGSVTVAGTSCSPDFPAMTIGSGNEFSSMGTAYSLSCGPNHGGAFVAKLNPFGTAMIYATYLEGADSALSLALGASGSVYVAGAVRNRIGPGFNGSVPRGPSYLAKIAPGGDKVESFVKLNGNASARSIALAPSGDVLVTGATDTSLLPRFEGAFQLSPTRQTCYPGAADAYVLRTTPDLLFTAFSFLGAGCEEGVSVRADRSGNIWVSGSSGSRNFPEQSGYQSAGLGFVAELTPNANALLFSSKADYAPQLNVSREGTVFMVSSTGRLGTIAKNFLSNGAGGTALLTRIDP